MENNFNEEDKKRVITFLNMVAKHADFKFNTNELIEYFKVLSHMQKVIVPKIDSYLLEVKKIVEPQNSESEE